MTYLADEHPKSDKVMVIGCLSEVLKNCPLAINAYFQDFMTVLMKQSTNIDGAMTRNVAYGFGTLAEKTPHQLFTPHLSNILHTVKLMHA